MPLTEHEKIGLTQELAILLEANEPEAMLAVLRRVADRMARRVIRASISDLEALRWQKLAEACASVEKELELANAPRTAQQTPLTSDTGDETSSAA